MPETTKDELSFNKIIVLLFTTALASSSSTIGVQRYFIPAAESVNQEIVASVAELSLLVRKQYTDPDARPDAFTKSMANAKFAWYDAEHRGLAEEDDRASRAIQAVRDHLSDIEVEVRTSGIQGSLDSARISKLEDVVTNHNQQDEGHAGIRRNTPIILDNQTKAHTHKAFSDGQ